MPSKYANRPYKVGKGKPPTEFQFGKDRPGSRKGRPPGSSNSDTILKKALAARVEVRENGRDRKISKLQVVVTQLVNKAAGGDLKAIEKVLRLHRDLEARTLPRDEGKPLSEADRAVLEQFAARLREDDDGDAQ